MKTAPIESRSDARVGTSLLGELRAATREAHAALDAQVGLDPQVTRERYASFLRGSLSAVSAIEPALASYGLGADLGGTSRRAAIVSDLETLGVSSPSTAAPLPVAVRLDSRARAMGAAYVMEGSSLGGVVLARIVDAALHLEGRALRYFRLYGEHPGSHWRGFTERLEAWAATATPSERTEACDAARDTFAAYAAALADAGAGAAANEARS